MQIYNILLIKGKSLIVPVALLFFNELTHREEIFLVKNDYLVDICGSQFR